VSLTLSPQQVVMDLGNNEDATVCVCAELESRGKQSIRVDCRPAGSHVDIVEGLDDEQTYNHEDNYFAGAGGAYAGNNHQVDPVITTSSYYESTEMAVTSAVTSSVADAETGAAMTTDSVTSSHHVTDDYSSSLPVNNSCECMSYCDVTDDRVVTSR